jgi:hypothetical protein
VDTTFFLQDGARPHTAYVLDGVHDVFGSRVLSDRFPKRFLGPTQPPTQWVQKGLTPGVKLPEREATHHLVPRLCMRGAIPLYGVVFH